MFFVCVGLFRLVFRRDIGVFDNDEENDSLARSNFSRSQLDIKGEIPTLAAV
ncbi:hypothetical protein VOA_002876 [Vibrio sp. RC586]|nr:hypothetical protein VOA_002876 [Vibrio sp. RC586]